jgi:hypothetical protein
MTGGAAGVAFSIHGATDFIATKEAANSAAVRTAEMPRLHQRESGDRWWNAYSLGVASIGMAWFLRVLRGVATRVVTKRSRSDD